jgi:hypothetical protein
MIISETNNALIEYKNLLEFCKTLSYKKNDVRLEFFKFMRSVLGRFYIGFANMDFVKEINDKRLCADIIQNSENYKNLVSICFVDEKYQTYFHDLSRQFIIDSWSVFELTVTQLLDSLLDENSKNEFLNKEYNQIKSILVENDFVEKEKVFKLLKNGGLKKDHITHQPITRRYDKLFSIIKINYQREIIKDKEFLKFLGAFRNGLHYNFVYSGNNFEFKLRDLNFKFINNDLIRVPDKPWELEVVHELIEICKEIFKCIDNKFIESKLITPPNKGCI